MKKVVEKFFIIRYNVIATFYLNIFIAGLPE